MKLVLVLLFCMALTNAVQVKFWRGYQGGDYTYFNQLANKIQHEINDWLQNNTQIEVINFGSSEAHDHLGTSMHSWILYEPHKRTEKEIESVVCW